MKCGCMCAHYVWRCVHRFNSYKLEELNVTPSVPLGDGGRGRHQPTPLPPTQMSLLEM